MCARLFLLRDSQSNPKAFVLTLCHHQKIKHFQILPVSHITPHDLITKGNLSWSLLESTQKRQITALLSQKLPHQMSRVKIIRAVKLAVVTLHVASQ